MPLRKVGADSGALQKSNSPVIATVMTVVTAVCATSGAWIAVDNPKEQAV